ncbi:trm-2A [Pristionchus pacificus]|nr:trm-2A [Pristionchus pacificus]
MADTVVAGAESSEETKVHDSVRPEESDSVQKEEEGKDENSGVEEIRVQIKNLPKFLGFKEFKKLLEKTLGAENVGKIRQMRDTAYVNVTTNEKAQEAIDKFNGMVVKKFTLECKMAEAAPKRGRDLPTSTETARVKTAKESVTPLSDMPYPEQLQMKTKECHRLVRRMIQDFYIARVEGMKGVTSYSLLNQIVPFSSTAVYRNKCEFTVGKSLEGKTTVGFVGGRFSKNEHYVLPVEECPNLSPQTKIIVNEFTLFVEESGLETFNEFERKGTWKMLTVREMSGDVLLIVTVFPVEDKEKEEEAKAKLIQRFHSLDDTISRGFRVTSLYWQVQANASDEPERVLLAGTPYIYETVLGVRFRVSPDAFFQTNSAAAAILYKTIGDACQLNEVKKEEEVNVIKKEDETEEEGVPEKRIKIEEETSENVVQMEVVEESKEEVKMEELKEEVENKEVKKTILLDICCGTGTIGQCIMKNIGKERAETTCCIGVELIESAVEDAKANARDNGISDKLCSYVAGKAEDTFRGLRRFVPHGFSMDSSHVIGVLDPPRRGIHHKVVVGCRELKSLERLIYVSCDPSAAIRNLTELCRPESNKFSGAPFKVEKITPVDMFPMTEHFEWVISLVRQ